MPPVNPNWHPWTMLSVANHIRSGTPSGLKLLIDNLDEYGDSWDKETHRAEVTIVGPTTKGLSGATGFTSEFRVYVDVNVVLSSFRTSNDIQHSTFAGQLASLLDTCIIIRDISTANPSGTFDVGEIGPRPAENENVEVTPVKPKKDDEQIHTVIRVRYEGTFSE